MKKTSFTLAKTFQWQPLVNPLSAVFTLVMLLIGNFAFGQIMDPCPGGSGNVVTGCPAPGPYNVFTDINCQAPVPDFKPGVGGTPGPGYQFVGVVQSPMAGDLLTGAGNYTVQVGAAFLDQTGGPGQGTLCAQLCSNITVTVVDDKPANISCAAPLTIDVDANCQFVINDAAQAISLFVPSLQDNCTPNSAMTIQIDVNNDGSIEPFPITLAGPSCPGPNPRPYTLRIIAIDAAGNVASCISNPMLRDNSGPSATCNNGTPIEVFVTASCLGSIPDLTGLPTNVMDACGGGVTYNQSPAPNTMFGLPCTGYSQPVDVFITDCFGTNTTICSYTVVLLDNMPPTINTACGSLPPQPTLVADGNCMVTIPDLTGSISVSDNCDMAGGVVTQTPPPGPYDVSGICPPGNFITVTFNATDCHGNAATPLVCDNLLTFTDNTAPTIVCPATPVPVVVPFDNLTCQHGTAMVDLATLIAGGVTVTDNCDPNPSLTSVSPNMFMCADIGKAGRTVTINAQDCFGNPATQTCAVNVIADTDFTAAWSIGGGDFIVCPAEFPVDILLGPNTPACGTWSGDVAVTVLPGVSNFTGYYDAANWTIDLAGSASAQVNTAGAPASVSLVSSNSGSGAHITSFTIPAQASSTISFDWSYSSANSSPFWDPFGYSVNGVYTQLTDDGGALAQSGTATVNVNPGDVFAFEARSVDQCCGAATTVISNFAVSSSYSVNAAAFPDLDGDGVPDPGSYSLTYTVGAPGCHVEETHNIMVSPQFNPGEADLVANFPICLTMGETFDLEGLLSPGSVQGGAFSIALGGSATGTQIGNLFQYTGGDGTLTVTYTLTDCDADTEQDVVVITIDEKPDGYFSVAGAQCQDGGIVDFQVSGVPAGATVSFSSIPAGFVINPAPGVYQFNPAGGSLGGNECADVVVTMTVSQVPTNAATVCPDFQISQVVRVCESGNPAFTIPATICETAAPLTLQLTSALNDGGVNNLTADNITWTGTSVTDNGVTGSFNPAVGPGTYTICVTVGAPSCEETQCHDIVVEQDYLDADVALVPNFSLCMVADEVIDFTSLLETGAIPGGHFIITSLTVDGTVIVNSANPLTWISSNSYTYEGGCGSITVRYQFDDDCSPATPTSDQVTITFEGKPDIGGVSLPGPLCATDAPVTITYSGTPAICASEGAFFGAGVSGNVGGVAATFSPATAGEGVHFITYSLTSPSGICDDVTVIGEVTVKASSPATFVLPSTACPGQIINLALANPNPSVTTTAGDLFAEVSWFGGDGLNAIVTDNLNGTGTFVGTVAGTYTVCVLTGEFGCMSYECHDITVDNVKPVMNCAPAVRTQNANLGVCTFTMPGTGFDVTATDNCTATANLVFAHNYPSAPSSNTLAGATFPVGSTIVTWTVTDQAGNSSSCSIEIVITDNQNPVLVGVPANVTAQCSAIPAPANVTATDNCPDVDVVFSQVITYSVGGPMSGLQEVPANSSAGTGTITATLTDPNGVLNVTVNFSGLGSGTTAAHIHNAPAGTNGGVIIPLTGFPTGVTSGNYTMSFNLTPAQIADLLAGNLYINIHTTGIPGGEIRGQIKVIGTTSIVRTWTAIDEAGNSVSASQTITVVDTQAPVFTNCPTTMVMIGNDVDQCSGKLNWSIPVATDNCSAFTVIQTSGPVNGTIVNVGVPQTVTYTATDIFGNSSTCTFQVQVVDTQKPDFDADIVMPTNITVECNAIPTNCVFHGNGICSPLTNDDVHDNCTPSAQLVITFTEVSTKGTNPNLCSFYNYTLTRTWTITDQAGNQRIHVQVITVQDTTPPVPVCQNATVTLDKNGNASINPATLIAGTTDNCAPFSALTVVASKTTFNCSNLGTNNVTLTISDPCNNQATCNIIVTVVEGIAPCTPQATLASTCLNNATTLTNGQFGELITIKSLAMQTWTVTSSTGLYTSGSAAPPAAPTPVPNGTVLTAAADMINYTLNARYVEAIGYTATLTNNLGQTVTISNVAHYPTPILSNFFGPFCIGTPAFVPQVVDQFAGANAYVSVTFLIDGQPATQINPAILAPGQHTLTIIADAGTAAFSRRINGVLVPGDAANSDAARLDPGCIQRTDVFFQIVTTPTQVVCNDLVQVTLEPTCSSVVTPDMVLEGTYQCFDDYEVRITLPNGVPLNPANVVTGAHAGLTLPYVLWHPISGNTCWGSIKVEDKTAPAPTCPAAAEIWCTVNPDSVVFYLPPTHPKYPAKDYFGKLVPVNGKLLYLGEPTATDCSSWTWQYTDDYIVYDCSQNAGIANSILRTFVITDVWGNQSTCTQQITQFRGEASHVNPPADKTFACNDPQLSNIAPSFDPAVCGWPQISGINITTTGTGICGLGVTYTDEVVNLCVGSYKVVRTWKIFDWCPAAGGAPTTTTFTQYIKVENLAPVITINCQQVNSQGHCILNASQPGNLPHYACSAINVPFANVQGICDNVVEVKVETPAGFTTNGGYIPSPGLPLGGPYNLIYRAKDQCGNITEFVLTVVVVDQTAPVAVCDEITDVNLSVDGIAEVFASTFDDGSYDGCCLDKLLVRKMVDNCDDGHNDLVFGPSVIFCCEDIANSPVTVVFRAVDCVGNYNDCMVTVNVNDKLTPLLVSCPSNQRITCDFFADNIETALADLAGNATAQSQLLDQYFGTASFTDNCDLTITRTININLDQCLEGTISRGWTAKDPSNNQSQQCNQTIFVDHVSDWVVEFPADITVNCGTTVPDFGEPEIFFETCELVGVSYKDELFTVVPDACYKILRTWTIINWCVVGAEIDQEVVESSERAFQLAFPLEPCDFDGDGDCDTRTFRDSWRVSPKSKPGAAQATQTTDPDTDPDSDPWDGYITYQQTIKVNDTVDPVFTNGCTIPDVCIEDNTCSAIVVLPTPEITECSPNVTFNVTSALGTGFGPFSNVAPGTYNVTYNVMDNCNNQKNCTTTITVKDCKKPTPYCKNGLVIELMQTGMVQLWASDFDAGSFDNCTPQSQLKLSFSANVNDTGHTYTCDDLGQQTVQLWVTDLAGNQDYCETFVIVQDNMNACDPNGTPLIGGSIQTEGSQSVSDVNVQLSGTSQASMMTANDGMFSFPVVPGGDYTVTPVKDVDPLNGVTTFDLVLITKHILGAQLLNSPYKIIAADANKSNSVTTFDLVQLRKLILFIDLEFPNNTSWRFVKKNYNFPNPANPWSATFPEVININDIAASQLAADFVAIKIGDVNGSAQPNFAAAGEDRNAVGTLVFAIDEVQLNAGEAYTIDFKARDFNVLGYQFTLNFDRTALEFVEVKSAVAGVENFGLTMLDQGAITTSWNDNETRLSDNEVVFSLVFKATASVKLSDALSVNSRFTAAEAYKPNGDLLNVELAFNGTKVANNFELYQNTPNPFSASTVVGFNLPEASAATLKITDVSGKIVKMVKGEFAKGYNEIKLERRELPATGILYYQLDTQSDSATKMMLLMD
jgi:hypothetical protein